ncbi:MAG: hypothetical protein L0Z50_19295 [Verrucomicrobiales bacterium]|nr:hypothetical protein [Verrucomicrobiales bacterium]
MSPSNLQARRATVDDLVELRKLWRASGRPVPEMEKQLKDFQIVETPDGILLGALALQVEGQQGRLHSENYVNPEFESEVRQRLWERVRAVARNYGLYRVWTDVQTPFWKSQGFEPASIELQKKLPASLGEAGRSWLVLQLREEMPASLSVEHEFELFTRAQRESSDRLIRQAQTLKNIAYVLLLAVLALGLVLAVFALLPRAGRSRIAKPGAAPLRSEQPSGGTNMPGAAKSAPAQPKP